MDRIWVVTEQYVPEQNTTAYYMTQIAEGLAEEFPVSVLCGQPNYLSRGLKAPKKEELNSVTVRRCYGLKFDKNNLLLKVFNMVSLGLSVFFASLTSFRKTDVVLAVTSPPVMPFLAATAARLKGAKFVLLVFDRYPQNMIASGHVKKVGLAESLINRLNRWLFRRSSRIIAVGRDMAEAIASQAGAGYEKVVTIQNWAMLEDVSPVPKEDCALVSELGLQSKLVVLYAGNMGPLQDIESIVGAAKLLAEEGREDVHFLFIGSGKKRPWLEEEVADLSNLTLLDPRPLSEQNSFLNACDLAVVPLVEGMRTAAMPSRTYNFLAAGKPVVAVCESPSELSMVVEEDKVGWVVAPGNPEAVRDAIREAAGSTETMKEYSRNAIRSANEKYSRDAAIAKYVEFFRESEVASKALPSTVAAKKNA